MKHVFDSFGRGVKIRINPRYSGFQRDQLQTTVPVTNKLHLLDLELKLALNYVVIFQHIGPKSSFSVAHLALDRLFRNLSENKNEST